MALTWNLLVNCFSESFVPVFVWSLVARFFSCKILNCQWWEFHQIWIYNFLNLKFDCQLVFTKFFVAFFVWCLVRCVFPVKFQIFMMDFRQVWNCYCSFCVKVWLPLEISRKIWLSIVCHQNVLLFFIWSLVWFAIVFFYKFRWPIWPVLRCLAKL